MSQLGQEKAKLINKPSCLAQHFMGPDQSLLRNGLGEHRIESGNFLLGIR
jgi:hypothetical protein